MQFKNRLRRAPRSRLLLILAFGAAGAFAALTGSVASAAPFAASASVSPQTAYLGDPLGTVFTFTIHNTGTSDSIGAVEIDRPGKNWTITGCPLAPSGWTAQRSDTMCRYRSAPGVGDNIAPGASSSSFQVRAMLSANQDTTGTWQVKVSKSDQFDSPSKLVAAATQPPGLSVTVYSFQIVDAVVDPATTTPGAACPAPNRSAITASTGHTLVICGFNRTTSTLTPTAALASLGGTFVASHGSFTSGPVAPSTTSRILGTWSNVNITATAGPGKTVIAKVGASSTKTSPLTTLTGYQALNNPPDAVNDARTTDEDTALSFDPRVNDTDPDGDPIHITAVGTGSTVGSVVITGGGTGVTYDPNGNFDYLAVGETATDTFTYTISDPYGGTDTATVTMTITGVNDPPTANDDSPSVGEDSTGSTIDVLANDTDPDTNDTLTVSAIDTTGTTGSVTNNGTDVTYDPNGQFNSLAAGETATDTFSYTVSDGHGGTDTATVTVTITGANDPPHAVNDTASAGSASTGISVDVLANDTDPDGDTLAVSAVDTTGTLGSVTNNGTDVTYDPNGAFDSLPKGQTATDTFSYTVSDGHGGTDTATVTVTITGVNHAPVANDDTKTVGEDSGGTAVDVLANDTDLDGDTLSVSGVDTTGTLGTVTNNGTDVTYDPNGKFESLAAGETATDTFSYTVSDGTDTDTATVTITITGQNDPPTASDDVKTIGEDGPAATVNVLGNDTDPDGDTLAVSAVDTTGTLGTVTNNGTDVTYDPNGQFNSLAAGETATDTFSYTVSDGHGGTDTATVTVTITGANDPPTANDDTTTVNQHGPAATVDVLANDTDPDTSDTLAVSAVDTTGTLGTVTNNGTDVTYDPNGQFDSLAPGDTATDTFSYTVSDGHGGTDTATVTVTISGANVPPVANDDTKTVSEDSTGTTIDVLANDVDTDPLSVTAVDTTGTTGTVTNNGTDVTYDPNGQFDHLAVGETATDTFSYTVSDGTDTDTATVTVTITGVNDPPTANDDTKTVGEESAGVSVDVLANDTDPDTSDTLAVSAVDTTGTLGTVTNNGTDVTYDPNGQFNSLAAGATTTDTFSYTVSDGHGGTDTATVTVTITGVNDPPIANPDATSFSEDGPAASVNVLGNDTDPDFGDTLTVLSINTAGTTGSVTNNGTDVTYNPNGKFESLGAGDTATDTFTYTVSDGHGGTDTATVTVTINGVDDAPVATADSFDAIGNTALFVGTTQPAGQAGKAISGSILTNDTDVDSPHSSLVAEPVVNGTTTLGGKISILADGSFTYLPDDGDTGVTDTFTYRVCSSTPCNSSNTASSTGTLSLPLAGQVWYVKNNAAPGGDGTSATPFDTLTEAEAASGTGDTTFVFDGDNTSTNLVGGYTMDTNEHLIGEDQGLSLDPDGGGPLPTSPLYTAAPSSIPTLTASGEDVVTLASGSVVNGFNIDPSGAGGGIFGGSGTSGVTVAHVHVNDTSTLGTQPGLELNGTSGTNTISDLEVDNSGAAGVSLTSAGTVNFASVGTVSLSTSGAPALVASATNLGSSVFDDVTVTGSGTGGVSLSNTTGSPTFANLDLTTTGGTGFAANTAGQVTVSAAGTANVSATGGPAVVVNGVSNGSDLSFDQVTSSGSGTNGISLSGLGTSTFSAGSGSAIGTATGTDFSLDGGSGAVSYAGTITDTTGQLVRVQNTSGGTKTFSGAITDSASGTGGGVSLSSNSGASVRFTGGLNLSTGSTAAFAATGGGTVGVTGSANTIATSTGTALNVANTSISNTDQLNFRSIAANGATNGIVLNNTGSGHLTVSGNSGSCTIATPTCTGGTIQNTTGDAISLTSTQGVSLTRMRIANNLGNGIIGSSVNGLSLSDSVVDNNADNAATDEAGLNFTNLTGTGSFLRDEVANSIEDNARIVNNTGTLTLSFNDSIVRDTTADAPGNDGLLIQADGGTINADVLGTQFLRNRADGLQVVTNGTGSIAVDVDDDGATPGVFDSNNIGVDIAHNSSGSLTYNVKNLTVDGLDSGLSASPININLGGSATTTMSGTISGNTLTNHGSLTGPGIRVVSNGTATLTTLIQNNNISGISAQDIQVLARDGSSTINATIKNNTVVSSGAGALDAIRVDAGAISTDTTKLCADITGNNATTVPGLNGIRIRQRFAGTSFKLAGYSGAATDDAAVIAYLNANNTSSPAPGADHGGAGFVGVASCPQP